ncbi:Glycosyl hydrolase family 20, domain 2 [Paenibacillus sp. UNCCL117]|uniref:glycoside hydrolase family 20 zincin-like fold domain-containing protein n=1 Tax=unclassified Paenibacillus TaxID=185978 RepID=UPI00088062C8|nr:MULTISPECIES: glycoside hydrolase family 20 zincin-like fold domain-containing protein [unclassified Paenibacillus]SDE10443.1 Glycosyl hydrolase family 20, domain 2 [Paenibacillus sp. cl123]SFW59767.1 Glycosyl hydrolase family 20, domain 2 [Paenibacillus sp. UNCCL117]
MQASQDRRRPVLLPTPKSAVERHGALKLGKRSVRLKADASLEGAAPLIRLELEKMGLATAPAEEGAHESMITLRGRETMSAETRELLGRQAHPAQAYRLEIAPDGATVCALEREGALHGIATLLQLLEEAGDAGIPAVEITDGPDIARRIISPTLTWYAGFARAGFGTQLWDGERWKSFVDWCFRRKINALNIVMYGFWPFEFSEYPETVLRDLPVDTWSAEIGDWVGVSYTHPNLRKPFLEELIRYANERGIAVYAYIGMNSYSGGYPVAHPDRRSVLSPELAAAGHVNNYDSLCTSREDVRRYLIASVKRIEELGFNGLVFEESEEVQWFCQCEECRRKYGHLSPNDAKHSVTAELLAAYIQVLKPETLVGIRWLREPPIVKDEACLAAWRDRLPERVKLFWAPGLEDDDGEFLKWVRVFGPDRIWSRNCEGSGFAASLGRIPYLIPDTFPESLQSYAFQHLWNDIAQFQGAVNTGCAAINGYGFEWYGHELFFMATAQYGWDCWRLERNEFLAHAAIHLHGRTNGERYERLIRILPCIHETQICPSLPSFPFMPNKYVGEEGLAYLESSAIAAAEALKELDAILGSGELTQVQRENAEATQVMTLRMKEVIAAGIGFNRFLQERDADQPDTGRLYSYARQALRHAEENYRLIKEHYFDTREHSWTGVPIGEYYIPMVINEYKKTFHEVLRDPEFAPDDHVPYIVGGESLPWEWLLEWGPRIAAAKPLAAVRPQKEAAR